MLCSRLIYWLELVSIACVQPVGVCIDSPGKYIHKQSSLLPLSSCSI